VPLIEPEVHVYASGREFVVVPVMVAATGETLEVTPVEHVNLVIGRATMVELTRALRELWERSSIAAGAAGLDGVTVWGGDNGRWWAHNLLFVVLRWGKDGLTFARQERASSGGWETAASELLPHDTPFAELAEKLIYALGEQLHR
jgi:hypothetical protein